MIRSQQESLIDKSIKDAMTNFYKPIHKEELPRTFQFKEYTFQEQGSMHPMQPMKQQSIKESRGGKFS